MKDERDKSLLVGAFLYIKVMAGKLFFKPYKLCRFFETDVGNLDNPILFKENCLTIAYTFIAMFTDYLFDLYKPEMERINGMKLTAKSEIARVKQDMFQDLMPISDDYVRYADFETFQKRSEWRTLVTKMSAMISKTLEAIKAHRHLTD